MMKFGYFDGRVLIGKFSDDPKGYEARGLLKALKLVATTYHLPGPSLLPIRQGSISDKSKFLVDSRSKPALAIFGSKDYYDLYFPHIKYEGFIDCSEVGNLKSECKTENLQSDIKLLPFRGNSNLVLAVPALPAFFKIEREPRFAVSHLISWISAYFSPNIYPLERSRLDVLS